MKDVRRSGVSSTLCVVNSVRFWRELVPIFGCLVLAVGCASSEGRGTSNSGASVPSSIRPSPAPSSKPPAGLLPQGVRPAVGEAFFEIETILGDRFVFKLIDPGRIRQAREILEKKLPKRMVGIIVPTPQPYNKPWRFHVDPASVGFSYLTDDRCDGAIHYIEEHLAEVGQAILPENRWCPSSSRLTRELLPTESAK